MAMVSMESNDTKTCRIVPKKYNYIPDLLLQNKRIEEETTMDLNPKEIQRAMMLADVYAQDDSGEETLLTPLNFYLKEEESTEEGSEEDTDTDDEEEVSTPPAAGSETEETENDEKTEVTEPTE